MLTLKQAMKMYEKIYPDQKIATILDVGDEWVVSAIDRESGLELDLSPIAVHKKDGAMRTFFPPLNMDKLKHAVPVEWKNTDY